MSWKAGSLKRYTVAEGVRVVLTVDTGILLNSLRTAVIVCDADRRITNWNAFAESLFHWTQEEVRGCDLVGAIVANGDRETVSSRLPPVLPDEGYLEFELEVARKNGAAFDGLVQLALPRDEVGNLIGYVAVVTDNTETKRREKRLRENETRLKLALEAGGIETWSSDLSTGIVTRSANHDRLFGYSEPLPVWTQETFMSHVHPDDRPAIIASLASGRNLKTPLDSEFRIIRADGITRWLWVRAVLNTDEPSEPPRLIGVVRDITDRKNRDAQALEVRRLESLSTLAGGVAHDFNNLLTGIIGNAALAMEMITPEEPAVELIQEVLSAGEQAAILTRKMLTYAGRGPASMSMHDPHELLREAVAGALFLSRPKIEILLDLAENPPHIRGDRAQLIQTFSNVILNAIEAIGDNAGTIHVRTRVDDPRARADAAPQWPRAGRFLMVEVEDNGCGMDAATMARIFEPFFGTKFVGRGLGLAAAQGIVRRHAGTILVNSTPGQGTKFRLLLPI